MLTSCGCQAYSSALFHLETHAFFKALLFLSAGLIIHGLGGEQDLRKMSGILNFLPLSCFLLLIGALALTGTQPLAGSYSKHNIIEMVTASPYGGFSMFGLLTVSFITIAYTFRNFLMVHGQMTVFGYSYPTQPVVSVTKKNLINIHETRD
jgi:NADH-quinone oxidoreductase subunit L